MAITMKEVQDEILKAKLRDRDVLWCRALINELTTDQIEKVTGYFQMIRDDPRTPSKNEDKIRVLLSACQRALALIKDHWPYDHGQEDVGLAWGELEQAIAKCEAEG